MWTLVLVCLLLGYVLAKFLLEYVRVQLLTKNVPTLPGSLPILGICHRFLGSNADLYRAGRKISAEISSKGGLAKFSLGPFVFFGITDPTIAMTLMNHSACLNKSEIYKFTSSWLGNGLLTAKAPVWKQHRKLLNPTFSQQTVNSFLEIFNRQALRLVSAVAAQVGNKDLDIWPYVKDYALETICQTAIGLPTNEDHVTDEEYTRAARRMLCLCVTRLQNIWMYSDILYKFTETKKQEDKTIKILKDMSTKVLLKRQQERRTSPCAKEPRFKAFLDLLLDLGDDGTLTNEEIKEEVDTIIATGYDTVASILLFMFILIGSYPKIQQRIYEELKDVFEDTLRDVTKDDLSKLTYLDVVIKEVLRLYPTAPIVGRAVTEDIKMENFTIPSGTGIALFIEGMMKTEIWGEDAKIFRPERWLDPSSVPKHPAAFAAFSIGRRNCIGKTYAMTSIKTMSAHFLRRYKVTADYTRMEIAYEVVLKPICGYQLLIENR